MRIFFTVALVVFLASYTYGQTVRVTTETEYKYMKKGYGADMELGRDVKAGYFILQSKEFTQEGNKVKISGLHRTSDNTTAGYILEYRWNDEIKYYCIPVYSTTSERSFGWKEWYYDVSIMSGQEKSFVLPALSWFFSIQAAQLNKL